MPVNAGGWVTKDKISKLNSIKLNNFSPNASFQSLLHFQPPLFLFHTQRTEDTLAWFKSYLSERLQTTRVATSVSSPLLVIHGVPQGSILGPMLFNLYMNDLPSVTEECETESYVDDTMIYLSVQPIDLENGILRVAADLTLSLRWYFSTLSSQEGGGCIDTPLLSFAN